MNLRIQDDKHPMIMSMQPRLQLNIAFAVP